MIRRRSVFRFVAVLAPLSVLVACVPGLHIRELPIDDALLPSTFATYRWQSGLLQEATIEERVDTEFSVLIRQTMDQAMGRLGYTRADGDDTAMILDFQLTIDDSVEAYLATQASNSLNETLNYGVRWRFPQGAVPVQLERMSPADEVVYFSEGILHMGAFSPDKTPIWHVMGHKILDSSHTRAKHRSVLATTVDQIMQRLPPASTRPGD